MEKKYVPIDCNFYDEIEILAMRKSKSTVVYLSEKDEPTTLEGVIKNVYAKNKEEFLEMESGLVFRLDRLISLDGKIVPGACEI
jgi:Rho-binding antiterminator